MRYLNLAFYIFSEIKDPFEYRRLLREFCADKPFKGTLLLSSEGLNGMVSGEEPALREFQTYLRSFAEFAGLEFKESWSGSIVFPRMLVRVKKEIISLGLPEIKPQVSTARHLEPVQLKQWLDEGKEVVLVDTRNDYEADIGTFKNAVRFDIKHFRDFPAHLAQLSPELKDKTVVMFCTGGIRCEKATAVAESAGFKDVYQLDGGILNYFKECGDAHYDGNCFVFDRRVAINPELGELSPEQVAALSRENDVRAAAEKAHLLAQQVAQQGQRT